MFTKTNHGIKKIFLIIAIVLGVLLVLFLGYKTYKIIDGFIFDSKESFTTEELEKVVYKIYRENMGFTSSVYINYWNNKKNGSNSLFKRADPDLLNPQNFYISTQGGNSWIVRHFEPTEVTAAFECFLYLEGKELPGELIGIVNNQSTGAQLHPNMNTAFFTVTDFEQIRSEVDISGLTRRKAAKKLAEAWIEKHNYVKR